MKKDRIENAIRHIQTATDVDPWAAELAVEALKAQLSEEDTTPDCISRQAAIDVLDKIFPADPMRNEYVQGITCGAALAIEYIKQLPSAQQEPLSDAYTKAVWTWLLDYQIKVAELKGRYTPYEVLSWVANDWRKEHDGSD